MNYLRDNKNIYRLLIILVIAGSLLRLFVCFQHNPLDYLFSDPLRHWLNGARFFHPDIIGASDPFLYQVYIFILRVLTGDNRYLIAITCGILSAIMPWTYYRSVREFGFSRNSAMVVWALIAWMPSLFTIYHYIAMETILMPLLGLSIWMTGRFMRKGTMGAWIIVVFCWTLACLTKATVVPLAAVCLIYSLWILKDRIGQPCPSTECKERQDNTAPPYHPNNSLMKSRIRYAATGLLLVILLFLPNALRTKHYLGFFAPLGNPWIVKIQHYSGAREIKIDSGKSKFRFASPSVTIRPLTPLSLWAIRRAWEDTTVIVKIDPANGEKDWQRTYQALNIGWKERSLQLMENVILFLFSPSWPDCNRHEWDGWLTHHLRWLWIPLIFFVFDCNLREFWRQQFCLIPVAVTVFPLFLAFQNLATTEGRYRKPLEPLLLINLVWSVIPSASSGRKS